MCLESDHSDGRLVLFATAVAVTVVAALRLYG
jgi:hypothetical protein